MQDYMPRLADQRLKRALETSGAVLIEGPKWCGKTRTASEQAASELLMQHPDLHSSYIQAASVKPSLLLEGDVPRLLDEWQTAPVLWDAVRYEVDRRQQTGQFILTGSAVPLDDATWHSGTGRIARLRMRTMSLAESGDSSQQVSLAALFASEHEIAGSHDVSIERLADLIARGGWPQSIHDSQANAEERALNYVDAVIQRDVIRVDGVEKNPQTTAALLRSLARNTASEASLATLRRDIAAHDDSISHPTLTRYLNALERIFVTEDLPAWNPAIRSRTPLRTAVKRHFIDPSIALAVLGINGQALLRDFETFGLLFESLCVRDLRIYADALGGRLYHYRDKTGLECDAVVALRDGRWGAIEVKMGATFFDQAAENLTRFTERIDTKRMNPPSFLMILSASPFAYRREDGVYVVPLACLGP